MTKLGATGVLRDATRGYPQSRLIRAAESQFCFTIGSLGAGREAV